MISDNVEQPLAAAPGNVFAQDKRVAQMMAVTDVRSMVKVVAPSVGWVLITGGVVAVAAVVTAGRVGHPPLPQVTPSTIVTRTAPVLVLAKVVVRT